MGMFWVSLYHLAMQALWGFVGLSALRHVTHAPGDHESISLHDALGLSIVLGLGGDLLDLGLWFFDAAVTNPVPLLLRTFSRGYLLCIATLTTEASRHLSLNIAIMAWSIDSAIIHGYYSLYAGNPLAISPTMRYLRGNAVLITYPVALICEIIVILAVYDTLGPPDSTPTVTFLSMEWQPFWLLALGIVPYLVATVVALQDQMNRRQVEMARYQRMLELTEAAKKLDAEKWKASQQPSASAGQAKDILQSSSTNNRPSSRSARKRARRQAHSQAQYR